MLYNNKILIKICIFLLSSVSFAYNAHANNLQMRKAEDIDPFTMSNFHVTTIGIKLDKKENIDSSGDKKHNPQYIFFGFESSVYNNNLSLGFEFGTINIPDIISANDTLFTAKLTYPIDLGSIGHISPILKVGLGWSFNNNSLERRVDFGSVNFLAVGIEYYPTIWLGIFTQVQSRCYDYSLRRITKNQNEINQLSDEDIRDLMKTTDLVSISEKINIENLLTIGFKINF